MIRQSIASSLFVFCVAGACLPAYAQGKKACDLVSQADVESILGTPLQPPQAQTPFRSLFDGGREGEVCSYTNFVVRRPVPDKRVDASIEVRYSDTPNATAVDEVLKRIDETLYDDATPVPDLGDAALWIAGRHTLIVFSAGKTMVMPSGVTLTLDEAKALATKALGTTAKTGFVYGTKSPFTKPALGARPAKPTQIEQLKFDLTAKADTGNARAQFALGNFYEYGMIGPDGIPKPDYPAAAYWYREASDRGEAAGSFALALIYRDGRGMTANPEAALILFRKAAVAGFVPAMAQLANAYLAANTDTSVNRATRWADESAKAGDPEGHLITGYLYNKGWLGGSPQYYYPKAMESYRKSAEGGDCVAMMNIGGLYFNGDGVPQDKTQAEGWFAKAQTCNGTDLDWMRDKAARYQQKAKDGKLPVMDPKPPLERAQLQRYANSLLAMMSMTLGVDVLSPEAEDVAKGMSISDMLRGAMRARQSACFLAPPLNALGCQ